MDRESPTPSACDWADHIRSYFRIAGRELSRQLPHEPAPGLREGLAIVICTYRRAESFARLLDSFTLQSRLPEQFIVVDASPDDATERVILERVARAPIAVTLEYFRVCGPLKGLTRQRNFGLRWVENDVIGFFDDDVVLETHCLREMERVHRRFGNEVVGVGAYIENGYSPPTRLWRLRRALGIVSNLRPGSYHRSGMSVPWGFLPPTHETVEGEWLIGCSMMWKTAVARDVGFCSAFDGYAQGEDLEFSLRMRSKGKLMLAGTARLQHFHEPSGRPDFFKLGYMAIYNRYQVHRSGLADRTWRDIAWFVYAWTLDSLLLARRLFRARWITQTLQEWAGRTKAAIDLILPSNQRPLSMNRRKFR